MILEIGDWKFDIDMAATMEYSSKEAAEHCTCTYCRNFYATVDAAYPLLRSFLARFGIDVEAPDAMSPTATSVRQVHYDPMYFVFGQILQSSKKEMNSGAVTIFAVRGIGEYQGRSYFELHTSGMTMPWILKEPYIPENPIK